MSDDPFQEKADWKGKIGKIKDGLTRFMQRRQNSDAPLGDETQATDQAPQPWPDPTFKNSDGEKTLTEMIRAKWQNNVAPRLHQAFTTRFGRKESGGGTSTMNMNAELINFFALFLAVLLTTYIAADLTALILEKYIPEAPASRGSRFSDSGRSTKTLVDYQMIISRNLFNSRGLIPGDEIPTGNQDQNNEPVKSTLPLNLIGTVILKNELRSIATIEDKDTQQVYPVRVDDELPGKARILNIEPYRVIFLNPGNGRREFIELPEELGGGAQISLGAKPTSNLGAGVEQTSATQFNIPRTEVDKALANMNEVLTQARAIPNSENGMPAGYKLIQIVAGSIYDKLGLKNGDVLCGLNGEPINDPGKAWELLGQLKTQSRLELCVKRDGRVSNNTYDIR